MNKFFKLFYFPLLKVLKIEQVDVLGLFFYMNQHYSEGYPQRLNWSKSFLPKSSIYWSWKS